MTKNRDSRDCVVGNTSKSTTQSLQYKQWLLTLPAKDISYTNLIIEIKKLCFDEVIFQRELGKHEDDKEKEPYEHFHIYINLKKRARFTEIKKVFPTAHIEKVNNTAASKAYAQKLETRIEPPQILKPNPYEHIKTISYEQLYPWQLEILNIISTEPDDRTIHYYWSTKGKMGKTQFCRYLTKFHNAYCFRSSGNTKDILFATTSIPDDENLIVFDFPRCIDSTQFPYIAIEELKDGLFFSSKYESKMCLRNYPHIFIFSNYAPILESLSADRWIVKNID